MYKNTRMKVLLGATLALASAGQVAAGIFSTFPFTAPGVMQEKMTVDGKGRGRTLRKFELDEKVVEALPTDLGDLKDERGSVNKVLKRLDRRVDKINDFMEDHKEQFNAAQSERLARLQNEVVGAHSDWSELLTEIKAAIKAVKQDAKN